MRRIKVIGVLVILLINMLDEIISEKNEELIFMMASNSGREAVAV
jgi:hypothetical protein